MNLLIPLSASLFESIECIIELLYKAIKSIWAKESFYVCFFSKIAIQKYSSKTDTLMKYVIIAFLWKI